MSRLIILEGPDGGGKTTLMEWRTFVNPDAGVKDHFVHSGPFKRVTQGLARLYVEAMLPALLGHADVVMDRAWLSEPIYAARYREAAPRLDKVQLRMLDRIAMRLEAGVVLCLPPQETCLATFRERRGEEMLEREQQLKAVYLDYAEGFRWQELTALPVTRYDRTKDVAVDIVVDTTSAHPLGSFSGGNLDAPIVLIGDKFGEVKNHDPRFQVPFVSFDRSGCSHWLTETLEEAGIAEGDLLWVNSDSPNLQDIVEDGTRLGVFTLGLEAYKRVQQRMPNISKDQNTHSVDHPQAHKRFQTRMDYPLVRMIKEILDNE